MATIPDKQKQDLLDIVETAKRKYLVNEILEAAQSDPDHFYQVGTLEEIDGAIWGYFNDDARTEFTIEVWVAPGAEKSAERVVLNAPAIMALDRS